MDSLPRPHSQYNDELNDLIAGTVGGISGVLVGQPFDLVKVRLQSGITGGSTTAKPLTVAKNIFLNEGFFAFWKGIIPPIISNVPINALGFATYGHMERLLSTKFDGPMKRYEIPSVPQDIQEEFYKKQILNYSLPNSFLNKYQNFQQNTSQNVQNSQNTQQNISNPSSPSSTTNSSPHSSHSSSLPQPYHHYHSIYHSFPNSTTTTLSDRSSEPNWWSIFIAGCWSGFFACLISSPSELLKIQEQNVIGHSPTTRSLIKNMVQEHGIKSLFRGFWTTVGRDAGSVGLYFLTYFWLKWTLRDEIWTPQVLVDGKVITQEESKRMFQDSDRSGQNLTQNSQFSEKNYSFLRTTTTSSSTNTDTTNLPTPTAPTNPSTPTTPTSLSTPTTPTSPSTPTITTNPSTPTPNPSTPATTTNLSTSTITPPSPTTFTPPSPTISINWEHNIQYSFWVPLIGGSIAGPIGWASTYPIDVVKTRLQSMPYEDFQKTTFFKCGKEILTKNGWKFFTRGLGTASIGAIPMNAITFLGYEWTLDQCKKNQKKNLKKGLI